MIAYAVNEADGAILIALAALLNADVEGMKAENHERIQRQESIAYVEDNFYHAGKPLRVHLKSLEVTT